MFGREKIEYKTVDQVRTMRRAGLVVADALATVRSAVRPGMTTADLDALAAAVIGDAGATPSFLGYHGYPATLCVSVNDEVVHGIPGTRELLPGDVVSVDCGAIVDGWHGDSAFSFVLPEADAADVALVEATERALWAGIAALATGERLGDVGNAVEDSIEASAAADGVAYGIIEEYVGHGIGTSMHQPPDVLNYRTRERGPRLKPGMCLAIEPMVTRGERFTQVLEDDWTVVTDDGARAAHWEHSVAILEDGIWVLTAPDGGAAKLGELGVTIAPLDV
ncbi:type I methionyl aminopeptidase [Oerskovia enterophila]|uniref:Methionine aminopeptidase n=1 Tax=Oerskovia enterophila TaxID=43678 RepID=A0A163RCG9_9CELL|nr:type I methionyl aminopeptidase [Oerskovia enterophila]KZM35064.1 methionine aminopeptidase 1 [Oerskovia enterophila]OCI32429.1 methionine aminopeptidase 1 [Oerskovia enterophila]